MTASSLCPSGRRRGGRNPLLSWGHPQRQRWPPRRAPLSGLCCYWWDPRPRRIFVGQTDPAGGTGTCPHVGQHQSGPAACVCVIGRGGRGTARSATGTSALQQRWRGTDIGVVRQRRPAGGWVPARNRSDAAAGARALATARGLTAPVGGCHPAFPVVAAEGKARFRPWLERTRNQCFVAGRRRLGQSPRRSTPLSPGSSGEWSGFKSSRAATWGCRFAMRP